MAGEVHAGLAQMGEANATPDPSLVAVAESLKALAGKAILDSDTASKALAELGRLLLGSPAPTASELERLELPQHLLELLQRDTFSTEELVTHLGVEEATPALISTLLQLVEASEALPVCPLPAYLSKAAGLRMLSEPLILAVDSELDTGRDRRPQELRRHWLQVDPLVRMGELERVAQVTTPVLGPASSRGAAA